MPGTVSGVDSQLRGTQTARVRSGNRRDAGARDAVLRAADDLLVEVGFAKTTVEGIAKRAGVAKQTVYRWWPSKVEILLDGLLDGVDKYLSDDLSSVDSVAFERYVERFRSFIDERPDGQVFLALLGHAQHDARVADLLQERLFQPLRSLERNLVLHAKIAASEREADALLDGALGAIVYGAMTNSARRPRAGARSAEADAGGDLG